MYYQIVFLLLVYSKVTFISFVIFVFVNYLGLVITPETKLQFSHFFAECLGVAWYFCLKRVTRSRYNIPVVIFSVLHIAITPPLYSSWCSSKSRSKYWVYLQPHHHIWDLCLVCCGSCPSS